MKKYDLGAASEAARFNRKALERDKRCGCYCCLAVYSPSEIKEWCAEEYDGEGVTAICPYCDVDSVLAESAGFPLTQEFLKKMQLRYFGGEV